MRAPRATDPSASVQIVACGATQRHAAVELHTRRGRHSAALDSARDTRLQAVQTLNGKRQQADHEVMLARSIGARPQRLATAATVRRCLSVASSRGMMEGMLVLELANVLAGPTVCQFMAELGADVIKVENSSTSGDVTRTWKLKAETGE